MANLITVPIPLQTCQYTSKIQRGEIWGVRTLRPKPQISRRGPFKFNGIKGSYQHSFTAKYEEANVVALNITIIVVCAYVRA